jgi:hypothetical protein
VQVIELIDFGVQGAESNNIYADAEKLVSAMQAKKDRKTDRWRWLHEGLSLVQP